jgi:hypothetical protein
MKNDTINKGYKSVSNIVKERFEDNNINNIECKQGDAGNIPFENETFDAFPDKEKTLLHSPRQ